MNVLGEAGVRVVALGDKNRPIPTRTPQYVISWHRGLEIALGAWRAQGIRRVVIPTDSAGITPALPKMGSILRELDMTFSLCSIGDESMEAYVNRLAAQPAGVVFAYDIWHAQVCAQAPRAFVRLLANRRVLNCWSLPIKVGLLGRVHTDAVVMPWERVIARLVGDLNSGAIFSMTEDQIVEAEWTPSVPAARLSRVYDFEAV